MVVVLRTMPSQEGLVRFGSRSALHSRRDRTRRFAGRTVAFLEIPRPESDAQVFPAVDDGAGGERPEELLQLLL